MFTLLCCHQDSHDFPQLDHVPLHYNTLNGIRLTGLTYSKAPGFWMVVFSIPPLQRIAAWYQVERRSGISQLNIIKDHIATQIHNNAISLTVIVLIN